MPCRGSLRTELYWGLLISNIYLVPPSRARFTDLVAKDVEPSPSEMIETQHIDGKLVDTVSLHGILCPEWYMLLALQIKGDPKWG